MTTLESIQTPMGDGHAPLLVRMRPILVEMVVPLCTPSPLDHIAMPARTTAFEAADNIIAACHARRIAINPLLLQKLLYYAHAWHLVLRNDPLFAEPIEAWIHGPVVASVYRHYKPYGWRPIMDLGTQTTDPNLAAHYEDILRVYGQYDGRQLERLSHSECPWRDARKGVAPDAASNARITDESMLAFYKAKLESATPQHA